MNTRLSVPRKRKLKLACGFQYLLKIRASYSSDRVNCFGGCSIDIHIFQFGCLFVFNDLLSYYEEYILHAIFNLGY